MHPRRQAERVTGSKGLKGFVDLIIFKQGAGARFRRALRQGMCMSTHACAWRSDMQLDMQLDVQLDM